MPSEQTRFRDRENLVTLLSGPSSSPRELTHVPSQQTIILLGFEGSAWALADAMVTKVKEETRWGLLSRFL